MWKIFLLAAKTYTNIYSQQNVKINFELDYKNPEGNVVVFLGAAEFLCT